VLIAEVIVPQMFSAYAEDLDYMDNGLHEYQYFCEECDQAFIAAWGRQLGAYWYVERGKYFYCPHCGKQHSANVVYIKRGEDVPNKIRLTVKVYENVVIFGVTGKTIGFRDAMRVFAGTYKETIRFDIAKRTVLFSSVVNGFEDEAFEIGHPFQLEFLEKSILRFFLPFSLANLNQKRELNKILKVLRETVRRKLEKRLGHKIASMHVSPGQVHGTFLLPILNIAYRVLCPDAPNLPTVYREKESSIMDFWETKMISDDDYMNEVIAKRRKTSFVNAMVAAKSLPDRPYIRRVLSENPFDVCLLSNTFRLCSNYDYAVRLFEGLRELSKGISASQNKDLMKFLRRMKVFYGEAGIVRLVEEYKEMQLWDCVTLFQQLNKENRKALKTESVKLRDLHDWMSIMHKKQNHVNVKFNVPEHIVKRLSMQKDRLRFFLPEESMQLLEAGHILHNCVASYGAAMKENQKWIVLVAEDKGKLVACLEIKEKELVQAKLDRNKPVSNNAELNSEIVAWAKEANIKINTLDIKVPDKKKTRIRVPA